MSLASSAATHPGAVRPRNEDNLLARPDLGLWVVADGVGGHGSGDVASAAIAEALGGIPAGLAAAEMLAQVRLRLGAVHAEMQARAVSRQRGGIIASTVAVLLVRGRHFAALWAGDSRIYLLRAGALHRLTHDHSVVQEMMDSGVLSPDEAATHPQANVITRAVGAEGALHLDKVADRLQPADRFVLCSDGFFKELTEAEIAAHLARGARADELVNHAIAAGGRDNISVIVVET